MRALALWIAAASSACAHVMSLSNGDLQVEGSRAHYELRMPLYEITHTKSPEDSLLGAIRFATRGEPARLVSRTCREDAAQAQYICSADYEFTAPVGRLDVECRFHTVTVANHVHLLRAVKEGKNDQAIFDASFSKAEIRFDPPTPLETAMKETGAGMVRALGGWVQALFLVALVLAARSPRELAALAGMFLIGQIVSAIAAPLTGWRPAPRFVEAAVALSIAYLAVEILALPQAGQRWIVAGVLGAFHGLYFALFLEGSGMRPVTVLGGAVAAELVAVALLALLFRQLRRVAARRLEQVAAALLLLIGLGWFFLRVRG